MPDRLQPESLSAGNDPDDGELRHLTRSPHPYHHLRSDIPHAAHRLADRADPSSAPTPASVAGSGDSTEPLSPFPSFTKESTPASDSGTEADDEHFLLGLPAPKPRLHKGLRSRNEFTSGTSSPMYSPSIGEEDCSYAKSSDGDSTRGKTDFWDERNIRRYKEFVRRTSEFCLVGGLFAIVQSKPTVKPIFMAWERGRVNLTGVQDCALLTVSRIGLPRFTHRSADGPVPPASHRLDVSESKAKTENTSIHADCLRPGSYHIPSSDITSRLFSHCDG